MIYQLLKRTLDIIIAGSTLILLSPLFLLLIPLLRLTDEGEVWYRQKRIGYKNRYFYMLKFASMLKDSPNIGTGEITLRNDPRVTKVGRYLRMTKINELPQVWNVLKGDMTIVGPRPLVDRTFNAYPPEVRARIYDVRPGITGIGSIVFRDEEGLISEADDPHAFYANHIAPYKGELEMWYHDHASIATDTLLVFLTAWVIFFPDSQLPYQIFTDLPKRPVALQGLGR